MASSVSISLDDRVAIISGAATGIGRASALLFARAGARLLLTDNRQPELEATAVQVRQLGGGSLAVSV